MSGLASSASGSSTSSSPNRAAQASAASRRVPAMHRSVAPWYLCELLRREHAEPAKAEDADADRLCCHGIGVLFPALNDLEPPPGVMSHEILFARVPYETAAGGASTYRAAHDTHRTAEQQWTWLPGWRRCRRHPRNGPHVLSRPATDRGVPPADSQSARRLRRDAAEHLEHITTRVGEALDSVANTRMPMLVTALPRCDARRGLDAPSLWSRVGVSRRPLTCVNVVRGRNGRDSTSRSARQPVAVPACRRVLPPTCARTWRTWRPGWCGR